MTQKKGAGKDDLRVRRTRKLLQEAMISLTINKGFNALTVQDISEQAMVNRATFYRYYQDKYDLMDKYMEEQYDLLLVSDDADARPPKRADVPTEPTPGLVRMWEHIGVNAAFFRVMLGPRGDSAFTQKVRDFIEKRFRSVLPDIPETARLLPIDLCLNYISSASIGCIIWWLENNMPCSPHQMAAWSMLLSNADLVAAMGPRVLAKKR